MIGPRSKFTLQSISRTSDGMGGFTDTWNDVKVLKGVFMTKTARENFSNFSEKVYSDHYFAVRNLRDLAVDESYRFSYNSDIYKIIYVSNPGLKKKWTIFWLEKVEDSGGGGC